MIRCYCNKCGKELPFRHGKVGIGALSFELVQCCGDDDCATYGDDDDDDFEATHEESRGEYHLCSRCAIKLIDWLDDEETHK